MDRGLIWWIVINYQLLLLVIYGAKAAAMGEGLKYIYFLPPAEMSPQ